MNNTILFAVLGLVLCVFILLVFFVIKLTREKKELQEEQYTHVNEQLDTTHLEPTEKAPSFDDDVNNILSDAAQLVATGDNEQAVKLLHRSISNHPTRSELHLMLLNIFVNQQNHQAFEATANKLNALNDVQAISKANSMRAKLKPIAEPQSSTMPEVNEDIAFDFNQDGTETDAISTTQELDLIENTLVSSTALAKSEPQTNQSTNQEKADNGDIDGMMFDFDSSDKVSEPVNTDAKKEDTLFDLNFDDLPDNPLEDSLPNNLGDTNSLKPASAPAKEEDDFSLDFDMGDTQESTDDNFIDFASPEPQNLEANQPASQQLTSEPANEFDFSTEMANDSTEDAFDLSFDSLDSLDKTDDFVSNDSIGNQPAQPTPELDNSLDLTLDDSIDNLNDNDMDFDFDLTDENQSQNINAEKDLDLSLDAPLDTLSEQPLDMNLGELPADDSSKESNTFAEFDALLDGMSLDDKAEPEIKSPDLETPELNIDELAIDELSIDELNIDDLSIDEPVIEAPVKAPVEPKSEPQFDMVNMDDINDIAIEADTDDLSLDFASDFNQVSTDAKASELSSAGLNDLDLMDDELAKPVDTFDFAEPLENLQKPNASPEINASKIDALDDFDFDDVIDQPVDNEIDSQPIADIAEPVESDMSESESTPVDNEQNIAFLNQLKNEFSFVESHDVNTTNLELAKNCIQLGELNSAKSLLSEIMQTGNEEQKVQAQKLSEHFKQAS